MTGPGKRVFPFLCSLILLAGHMTEAPASAFQQKDGGTAAPQAQRPTDLMVVHGRLRIDAPTEPLRLGEENPLTVTLSGPALLRLDGIQRAIGPQADPAWIQSSEAELPIEHRVDGSVYVNVVPQQPGKLEFRFNAMFADGGFEVASVDANVAAPSPPTQLKVGANGLLRDSILRMGLSEHWRQQALRVGPGQPCYSSRSLENSAGGPDDVRELPPLARSVADCHPAAAGAVLKT